MPTDSDRIPNEDPRIGALMGALVADAAALGLHWIYDPDRIAAIISTHGSAAFVPIDPAHHADVPAYFAHGARRGGMLSQYGECLALAMRVINEGDGTLDTARTSKPSSHTSTWEAPTSATSIAPPAPQSPTCATTCFHPVVMMINCLHSPDCPL